MEFLKTFNAGHLRAFIAALFSVAFVAGFFTGLIKPDTFVPTATVAIGFYFGQHKATTKKENEDGSSSVDDINALLKETPKVKPVSSDGK